MVVQVAPDLIPKNCVVTISPGRAVPDGQNLVGGPSTEGTPRVLVEPDDEHNLGRSPIRIALTPEGAVNCPPWHTRS